jgi:hypothetical protein
MQNLPANPSGPAHDGMPAASEPCVPPTPAHPVPPPHQAHHPHHPPHPHHAHHPHHHPHHHHHGPNGHPVFADPAVAAEWQRQHDAENRRTIRRGLAWLAGLLVVMASTTWLVLDHTAAEQAHREALASAHAALCQELLVGDVADVDAAEHLLARLAATRAEWQHGSDAIAFERQHTRLQEFVTERRALATARAAVAELAASREADPGTIAGWRALLARGEAALAALPEGGAAAHTLLAIEVDRIAQDLFTVMLGAAGDFGADRSEELRVYSAAQALAHQHCRRKDSATASWQRLVALAAPRANAAQKAAFDDAAIARVPWTELLVGSTLEDWVQSRGTLLHRELDPTGLRLESPAGQASATVVIRRGPNWQCCELAVDLQLEAGEVEVFPRAARSFDDQRTGALVLRTTPAEGAVVVPAAQRVTLSIRLVGDQLVATGEGLPTTTQRVGVGERIGGFGLVVHPGTTLRLCGLRVRELVPGHGSAE